MKWKQVDDHYAESDAGYRVVRYNQDGVLKYQSWPPKPRDPFEQHKSIGISLNFGAAKELCEYDHRQRYGHASV